VAVRSQSAAVVCVALGVVWPLGCGGSRFSAGDSAAGGQGGGGAGGGAGVAGEDSGGTGGAQAGSATSGGSGGAATGGGAGKAGSAGTAGCDCRPGQYCRSGTCRDCSDLSSVQIGTPVELLDHPSSGLRFPRVGDSSDSLFFTLVAPSRSELWYVRDPTASASTTLGDAQTPSRSGLFYVEGSAFAFSALFDELENGQRHVLTATWNGTELSNTQPAGAPLAASGADDYSVALAAQTSRVYFMSTRDGAPALHTGVLGSAATTPLTLQVPALGGGTCPRSGDDATPWVTEDGSLLVFRALPVDAQCQSVDGSATDLYVAALQPSTGTPLTPAVALTGVNVTGGGSTETDPSFSPDLCILYFASDGGSAGGFDFKLFSANRR
jgi:hypothetical protein